ncbi:hypothetical protein AZE42_09459 [Rhizopogon vesiculosus]|uniref:Uncharacterized protein n=1 Tax=Rhizopogon vesiculosus TaxID=180088 RepID=A0A1J8QJV0_9AGAM|nr:hypothetical protein AZE42_09459 [Rhizopogon vesiculosus]
MENQCQSSAFGIPPDIKELLNTNRVPTDVQTRDITNLIQVQQVRERDMELERERPLRALDRTAQTLVEVSDMISDLQATISPVKRIPDEILALIFKPSLPPEILRQYSQGLYAFLGIGLHMPPLGCT